MKTALLVLGLSVATAYASIVPVKGERKLADTEYLTRQKQVLDLFVGIGHNEFFKHEYADYDLEANSELFSDSKYVKYFMESYKQGFLPKDGVFTMSCHHTRKQTIYLFDVFFFAKDFETFYKAACWAKKHLHPMQFAYAYTLALVHREDCQTYTLPPIYEIFPTYFVPQDTFHKVYDAKIYGIKEGKFYFNNTGYEYNYQGRMFGGPLSLDAYEPHLDYKVSYFREDVGANAYYAMWQLRYPSWMCPEKYKKSNWFKRGESFYYTHQQLFARYSLERIANGLPWVEPLYWDKPIKTGYTPRIMHFNGHPFYARPDNMIPEYFNKYFVKKAKVYESRLYEAIDQGNFWYNSTFVPINNEDGIDVLGKTVYGAYDRPNKKYFGNYYYSAMDALAYLVKTSNDHSYIGGVTTYPATTMRDPAFYNYLNRLMRLFQWHKKNAYPYTKKELGFPGVTVQNFEVDKLQTYFERFEFEITNGVPVQDYKEYSSLKYYASQYRINHKPFTYKVVVNSDNSYEGIVRVFVGPKFDSEEHELTLEQKRMLMVEMDRFPVKMSSGQNVFVRNSKDSPVFTGDYDGFREMYRKLNNAIESKEPYYIKEKFTCGVPERFQLPHGWKSGQLFTFSVVVSPFEKKYNGEPKEFHATCGSSKLFDYRPLGFPFDKPIVEKEFDLANIYFKDIPIYHKEDAEMKWSPYSDYKY